MSELRILLFAVADLPPRQYGMGETRWVVERRCFGPILCIGGCDAHGSENNIFYLDFKAEALQIRTPIAIKLQ